MSLAMNLKTIIVNVTFWIYVTGWKKKHSLVWLEWSDSDYVIDGGDGDDGYDGDDHDDDDNHSGNANATFQPSPSSLISA